MKRTALSRAWAAMAAAALVTVLAHSALAGSKAAETPSTASGGNITAVKVVRDTEEQRVESWDFSDVAGASAVITVPPKSAALILARFSTQGACQSSGSPGCSLRILIGGVEADPASGVDFFFVDKAPDILSFDRSLGPLGPGTYTVQVQAAAGQNATPGSAVVLDDWSLTVERVSPAAISGNQG